jgi:hypothetical protein
MAIGSMVLLDNFVVPRGFAESLAVKWWHRGMPKCQLTIPMRRLARMCWP